MAERSNARQAGIMCGNPKFQAYLGVSDADEAAATLRRMCGVTSRRELDECPAASRRFHELRRAFAYRGPQEG